MVEWFIFLRGVALGLLLALMLGLLLRFRQYYVVKILALLALTTCAYVIAPLVYGRIHGFFPVRVLAECIPLVFLLFVQAMFDEHRRPAAWSLAAGFMYILLGYLADWFPSLGSVQGLEETLVGLMSRALMAVVLAFALYRVLRNWQLDLVEPRRRLRVAISVIVGFYILGVVAVESVWVQTPVPYWVEVANSAGLVVSTLLFMAVVISLGPDGLVLATQAEPPTPPRRDNVDDPVLEKIVHAMEDELLYRDMELTIRQLGEHLGIPEHQLRRHINRELGYRNFNDFLNHYRLTEVSRRLAQPEYRKLPILTIAMDAGYRSMTTFNRAFKAQHGVTPREYREQH